MNLAEHPFARRGLVVGAGAAALAAGAALTRPAAAQPAGADGVGEARFADGSPVSTTIASAPVSGRIYRTVCMYDFTPFQPTARRTWGGAGVYSGVTASAMYASLEIPPGALVREVEYYLYNVSGSSVSAQAYVYSPGLGVITPINAAATAPSVTGIKAYRVTVPTASYGPYPTGARLLVGANTGTDDKIQINGARVGFSLGGGATGMLDAPIRVYDSRTADGKLAAGATRTITLPSAYVGLGVAAVLINLTAVNGEGNGTLKIYPANIVEPTSSAINFTSSGAAIANGLTVGISSARQLTVKASQAAHFIIDLAGVIS